MTVKKKCTAIRLQGAKVQQKLLFKFQRVFNREVMKDPDKNF